MLIEHAGHDYRTASLSPPLRALCDLAFKLTVAQASVAGEDIAELRSQGLSDTAIHDAVQVIAYFNYITRIADAIGVEDEPDWE